MEFFNISIPELLLIAGIALVIFGPERLPEVGRFLGKQVAKLLAWQQNSPELQMLNEVRTEFETEIASLRDELVRTRKQLDVSKDITAIKEELRPMLDLRGSLNGIAQPVSTKGVEPVIAPPRPTTATVPPEGTPATLPPPPAAPVTEPSSITPTPARQIVPAAGRPGKVAAVEPTSVLNRVAPSTIDAQLAQRLQQVSADLQALIAELQANGQLEPSWQPPSKAPEQEAIPQ